VAIWKHSERVFGIFSLRMRWNGYLGASYQKSDLAIRSGDLDFLQHRCISTTEWRLRDIVDIFCATCYYVAWHCDLDLWPFDLESVSYTVLLMSDPHPNFDYPTTIEWSLLNILSYFRYLKQPECSLYWTIAMLKRFSAAKKPSSHNWSQKWRFSGI